MTVLPPPLILLLTLLSVYGVQVQASTIYRCGNLYSEQPCPQAKELEFNDITAQRTKQQQQLVDQQSKQATSLEQARLRQEQAAQRAAAKSPAIAKEDRSRLNTPHQNESSQTIKPSFRAKVIPPKTSASR